MAMDRFTKTSCTAWLLAVACLPAQGVDFSGVPGTVLAYQPLQYDFWSFVPRYYIADPELAVLPNGDYVAAHTIAGNLASQDGFLLRWVSLTGRTYRVEVSTNLLDLPPFRVLRSGIAGEVGTTEITDTNAPAAPLGFYRTVVE